MRGWSAGCAAETTAFIVASSARTIPALTQSALLLWPRALPPFRMRPMGINRYSVLPALLALALVAACGGGDAETNAEAASEDSIAPGMVTGTTGAPGPGTVGTPGTPAATDPDTLSAAPDTAEPR